MVEYFLFVIIIHNQTLRVLTISVSCPPRQIERGDPDGSNRITMVTGLSHPWGVAVHENYLYFTDRDFEVIERVDKASGANKVVLRDNVSGLRGLKVHHRESEYQGKCGGPRESEYYPESEYQRRV